MQEKEKEEEVFMAERCEELGGLDEKREGLGAQPQIQIKDD